MLEIARGLKDRYAQLETDFMDAVSKRDDNKVQGFLPQVPPKVLEEELAEAKTVKMVQLIVASEAAQSKLSGKTINKVFLHAAKQGQAELVSTIFDHHFLKLEGGTVEKARRKGTGRAIPILERRCRDWAFYQAVKQSDLNGIRGNFHDFTDVEVWKAAYEKASPSDRLELVALIEENLIRVAEQGNIDRMQELIPPLAPEEGKLFVENRALWERVRSRAHKDVRSFWDAIVMGKWRSQKRPFEPLEPIQEESCKES